LAHRALIAVVVAAVFGAPLPSLRASAILDGGAGGTVNAMHLHAADLQDPERPRAVPFVDREAGVTITPPAGWVQSPASALNPMSDPPEPVLEVARFQTRIGDPELYATPIPITSGLVGDAVAVLSIGVAREGSDLLLVDRTVRGDRELGSVAGFTTLDEEATYEGLHVLTRYLFSREGDRALVVRAAALDTAWTSFEGELRRSIATFRGDPLAANAPAPAPPPPPPPPAPVVAAAQVVDETVARRDSILARAASVLGLRYVWGGNSTVNGMDCSAYVSWAWGVSRYTTDSIWNVSFQIAKAELRPGDALNLTTGRDPAHFGHIRIFEAWANDAHTAMWVFEETPPRVVHRIVAYDDRYQPIRLWGLSGAGEVRVVPGTPVPARTAAPVATRRPTPVPTRRPAATATRRPTPVPTRTPTRTVTPTRTLTPTAPPATPRPSASPRPRR
jgi:hypothetical protein